MGINAVGMVGIGRSNVGLRSGTSMTALSLCGMRPHRARKAYYSDRVYLSLSVDNFRQPCCSKFIFAHIRIYPQVIRVKFTYVGDQVKVKDTGAEKGRKCLFP